MRDHILRIHAKNYISKNSKISQPPVKGESSEQLPEHTPTKAHVNDKHLFTIEEQDCIVYSDLKSIQSDEELPDTNLNETSSKPKFKPKVPPSDYERFIYKCQYCMLGFKRRGKREKTFVILAISSIN